MSVDYSEIQSLNALGLHDLARESIERELKSCETPVLLHEAVLASLRAKDYTRAASFADRLVKSHSLKKENCGIVSLAYNFAGRHADAYLYAKLAADFGEAPSATDEYSLACRAASLGWNAEALVHILNCFKATRSNDFYLVRKAFLDSEIAPVWKFAAKSFPSLRQSLRVHLRLWRYCADANRQSEPERLVDHSDLKVIPAEFHELLETNCPGTFACPPARQAALPALYARYLDWQNSTATPRIDAFCKYMERVDAEIYKAQPLFAEFQAANGRFGAARYHLTHYLRGEAGYDPATLGDIPLLEPLLEEFRAQFRESPSAFEYLAGAKFRDHPERFIEQEYKSLPSVNRSSGMAKLYLGNACFETERTKEAIRAWVACCKKWPWDETPLLNMAYGFVLLEKPDKAMKTLDLVSKAALPEELHMEFRRHILIRSRENPCCHQPKIPTPEFDGVFPGSNSKFIRWHAAKRSARQQNLNRAKKQKA